MSQEPTSGWPRITILTPCLNAERYIAESLESVRRQHYPDLEHIVLDAGSNDSTQEILARFPSCRVLSEPDKGSHDAMNKGVGLASGEIIGFLNSDDVYANGVLAEVGHAFADDPALDVVVVGTVVFEETENGARRLLVARDHARESGFWLAELAFGAPGFNGRFFRRRVFDRLGGFNLTYDFSADRYFLTRIALSGAKSITLPRFGYFFRSHAGSRTLDAARRNAETFAREHLRQAFDFAQTTRHAPDRRRIFLAWHGLEGAKIAYFELRACHLGKALAAVVRLCRENPLWPFRLPLAFSQRKAVRKNEARSTAAMTMPIPRGA